MASAFTHGIVGFAAAVAYAGTPTPRRLWLLAAGCAMLPDADVLGFPLGIPYRSLLGHRGLSHSLPSRWRWAPSSPPSPSAIAASARAPGGVARCSSRR